MKIHIYQDDACKEPAAEAKSASIVYLNVFEGDGADVWEECRKLHVPPMNLVVFSGLSWDEQLSPWAAEPVFKGDNFTGGADEYLRWMEEAIHKIEKNELKIDGKPEWRGLAGYSLAGLFAVFAAYQTELFNGIASASGSFWFPEFTEFIKYTEPKSPLKCAYFSLGSKESKVRNPVMSTVLNKTKEAERILAAKGIQTIFEENPGNHFNDSALRTAKGIKWMLENSRI